MTRAAGPARRARRAAAAGLTLAASLFLAAFAGPRLGRWRCTDLDLTAFGAPPSPAHWFGTTPAGRDMYAITLCGMRRSLVVGLLVAVLSTGLAAAAGAFAGYAGGWVDRGLMGVADLLLVLPPFLVAAVLSRHAAVRSWPVLVPLLSAFLWTTTARLVRSMTMSLKEREHVVAARCLGATAPRIVVRHVLPHLAAPLLADAALNAGAAVAAEASLSYFGFGVRPPDVSLGTLIADGAPAALTSPWLFLPPTAALVLFVLAVDLAGEGLRAMVTP